MEEIKNMVNKYLKEKDNVDQWNEELRDRYHFDALNVVLGIAKNNAFFQSKMKDLKDYRLEKTEDFEKIQFTTKDELRGDPYLTVCVDKSQLAQLNISTGTTGGEMIYVFYTLDDLYTCEIETKYPSLISVEESDIVVNALPYELSSSGLSFQRVFQIGEKAIVLPAGKGSAYSSPEKTVKLMHKLQTEVLLTTPSHAAYLYEFALALKLNPVKDFNLKRIWLTGEGCSDNYRKRIEKMWGTKAYFYYGSLECGSLGIECDDKNGYHIPEAHVYIEIVHPTTGEKCEDGQMGEIITTTLLRDGNPFIRYRTGDLGYIDNTPCRCGIKERRLFLRGRIGDQLKVDGKEFSPLFIENLLMKVGEISLWYLLSVEDDNLYIKVERMGESNLTDEEVIEKIQYEISTVCNIVPVVEVVEEIPRVLTKAVRVAKAEAKEGQK